MATTEILDQSSQNDLRPRTGWSQVGHVGTMHSLSAGLIIHRVGEVHYDLLGQARGFAQDIAGYMNSRLSPDATTFVYEEVLGRVGRIHWMVNLPNPADYGRLLDMADHDADFRKIYEEDRLPERGGGNWEKMFLQGSFVERVLLPQHGFGTQALEELDERAFVAPARHQCALSSEDLVDSGHAGCLVLRSVGARYACRDLARFYLQEWQARVNEALAGRVTVVSYEEIWGRQDQLHQLVHCRSHEDHEAYQLLLRNDEQLRAIDDQRRVVIGGEEHGWGGLFEAGSLREVMLQPLERSPEA